MTFPRVMARLDRATQLPRVRAANGFLARVDTRALGGPLSRAMTHLFALAFYSYTD